MAKKLYDWKKIQEEYDNGLTWRGIQEKFGCSNAAIAKAVKRRDLVTRNKSEAVKLNIETYGAHPQTEETRNKISEIRKKFLAENPEKVPYRLFHSSKESTFEKIFRKALIDNNIEGWTQSYQNGRYNYDFAFVEQKINVEIDGGLHLKEDVRLKDERRDAWSKSQGWRVIRLTDKDVTENIEECIDKVKSMLYNT